MQTTDGADLVWGTRKFCQRKGSSSSGLKGELELARSERHTVPGSLRSGLWGWPCYGKAQEVSVTAGNMLWGESGEERRAGQARLHRPALIIYPNSGGKPAQYFWWEVTRFIVSTTEWNYTSHSPHQSPKATHVKEPPPPVWFLHPREHAKGPISLPRHCSGSKSWSAVLPWWVLKLEGSWEII